MQTAPRARILPLAIAGLGLAACVAEPSSAPPAGADEPKVDQPGTRIDGNAASPGLDAGVVASCSESAKLIYLVDENNDFLSFKPDSLTFTRIGTLSCPAAFGAAPFSMSIDRSATAWVVYDSGQLFRVSTQDASCQATTFNAGQQGVYQFGMGFVSNSAGSNDETLYIANDVQQGDSLPTAVQIGTLSFPDLTVTSKGTVSGVPELTGTGDGKLWGFFPSSTITPNVALLDKNTGMPSTSFALPGLQGQPIDWAFAFWGGDFWVFLRRDTDPSTRVYRINSSTGAMQVALPSTGRSIVGAGVSTCAPVIL